MYEKSCISQWYCVSCSILILLCLTPQSDVAAPDDCVTADMDADSGDDCVCPVAASSRKVLQYEYHVLYSCSYATPVLYFRVSTLSEFSVMHLSIVS